MRSQRRPRHACIHSELVIPNYELASKRPMPLVPPGRLDKDEYFETHVPVWQQHAAALPLPGTMVAALAGQVAATRVAFLAHEEAQIAAQRGSDRFFPARTPRGPQLLTPQRRP